MLHHIQLLFVIVNYLVYKLCYGVCLHVFCIPSLCSKHVMLFRRPMVSLFDFGKFPLIYIPYPSVLLAGLCATFWFHHQAIDVVRQSKVAEVLGSDFAKENNLRRQANSQYRLRRDSYDNVSERGYGEGDDVSIDKHWLSDLVSIHAAQPIRTIPTHLLANQIAVEAATENTSFFIG